MLLKAAWAFIDVEEKRMTDLLTVLGWERVEVSDKLWITEQLIARFYNIQRAGLDSWIDVDYRLNWNNYRIEERHAVGKGQGFDSLRKHLKESKHEFARTAR